MVKSKGGALGKSCSSLGTGRDWNSSIAKGQLLMPCECLAQSLSAFLRHGDHISSGCIQPPQRVRKTHASREKENEAQKFMNLFHLGI